MRFYLIRILNDGFDLGAQRRPRPDLPNDLFGEGGALDVIEAQKDRINTGSENQLLLEGSLFAWTATKERISKEGDSNLAGDRYVEYSEYLEQKWPMVELGEICELNPKKSEVKDLDTEVSFVPMSDVQERDNQFKPNQVKDIKSVYKGYTYFAENDVLLAKITPCFENGKSAIARGLKNGVGFGSTEFIVFRSSPRVLPEWIFLFISNKRFVEEGSRHMTGSAGQRRVDLAFVKSYKIPLPPLEVQKNIIAEVHSKQDAIEHAKAIIKNLERENDILVDRLRD